VGARLGDADLTGAHLERVDLSVAADTVNLKLDDAHAAGANLGGIHGESTSMRRADLRRATFQGASVFNGSFDDANLEGAFLRGAQLATSFQRANLRHVVGIDATLAMSSFVEADLTGAIFLKADLSGARFQNARLSGTNFFGANLSGAELAGAGFDSTTTWPEGFDPIARGAVSTDLAAGPTTVEPLPAISA
jgi:uncharacterized protein YjbI with pentapeptide repeats